MSTMIDEISQEEIRARSQADADAASLAKIQAEHAEKAQWRARQLGEIEHGYNASLNAVRRGIRELDEAYARRDALAMQVGPLIAELSALDSELRARRADVEKPALLAGKALGVTWVDVEQHAGVRPHQLTNISGDSEQARWARLVAQLFAGGHLGTFTDSGIVFGWIKGDSRYKISS